VTNGDARSLMQLSEALERHRTDIKAWERVGAMLAIQRQVLDDRYSNLTLFADERGVNYRLAWDIENPRQRARRSGRVSFTLEKIRQLADAYGVSAASIGTALDGGALTPAATRTGAAALAGGARLAPPGYLPEAYVTVLRPYADVIADRLDLAREHLAGADPGGADIFPDSPADARAWNALAAAGEWTEAEMAWQVAELQRRRVAARGGEPAAGPARA